MSPVRWAYRLDAAAPQRSPRGQAAAWSALKAGFVTESALDRLGGPPVAGLLLQLDRNGHLERELRLASRAWARVRPLRPPAAMPPIPTLGSRLQLQNGVLLHTGPEGVTLEAPGAWAQMQVLEPALMALVQLLARGCSLALVQKQLPQAPELATHWVQALDWCGLLARPDSHTWPVHERLFHSRTRRGFSREPVGRQGTPGQHLPLPTGPRHALPRGRAADLQMSLAQTLEQRQSRRNHAASELPVADLGRFLWHSLAEQVLEGLPHRPYPSGGRCYALRAYLAVSRCAGLCAGLYAYDAQAHELVHVAESSDGQHRLLQDAAASAQCSTTPQVLMVLCADLSRERQAYGDLSYSLLMKEVGALMQTAQQVATALGLACCPLGTGDSLQFAAVSHTDPMTLPSVGELLLGAPA